MENRSELFEFLVNITEDQRSLAYKMPPSQRILIVVIVIATIVWGSMMKCFLYKNFMKEKLSERPINVLIFLDQVVEHFTKLALALYAVIKVSLGSVHFFITIIQLRWLI